MYCGKEFHGYINEDGTYRIQIISTATENKLYGKIKIKKDTEAVIDVSKVIVKFEILKDIKDGEEELWSMTI